MKKRHLIIAMLCMHYGLVAQTKIRVTSIPINTPLNAKIYIAGSFNDWDLYNPNHLLTREIDGTYSVVIKTPEVASISYNFFREDAREGKQDGSPLENRLLLYLWRPNLVNVQIAGWEKEVSKSTADDNVRIMSNDFLAPQLNKKKRIWVYLPPNYETDTTKSFPVLYMQHGQHLFTIDSTGAEEWRVDETLNALFAKGDRGCIVVGIDGQAKSTSEYAPWATAKNAQSDGKAYAEFVVKTLKPFIDAHFRTKKDRINTGIAGSKEGGIESMYIAAEYPDVFSKVAVFSPNFSDSEASFQHIQQRGKQKSMRYCIISGSDEDVSKTTAIERMAATLKGIGHNFEEVKVIKKIDGEPTEWFWAREFSNAYKWLFREMSIKTQEGLFDTTVKLKTNDSGSVLTVDLSEDVANSNAFIYDMNQKLMFTVPLNAKKTVDINFLQAGNYILQCTRGEDVLFVKGFTKSK
jgi:predicted alpha/beta superfamily hydrolase